MNERSFEIFKKEKFFQKEGGIKFCEKLGIDRNKLNYYETSEPLSYYSHSKDFPQNILIMGAGQFIGARIGSRLVIRKGTGFIRPVFISMVLLITIKLILQNYH